ncbi:hypothetical protein [Proteiniborus sp. DW1]|uniref:hypothetical protein n=1 Tax=Proteiniborus sp. DW1 TaxID=1889883 RepID=UPI001FA84D90|nr:hypothetical protein [Proteiniborus sp. DW1]
MVLIMALIVTLSLVACRGEDIQEAEETIADPSANSTDAVDLPYQNVTPEQIQTLSDVLAELEPLYNEAAALAVENGWEADEITVQELNVVYTLIDAGKHGVADPSEYGDTSKEDMDVLVEQYQAILGAMPDLIAKVSELYEE